MSLGNWLIQKTGRYLTKESPATRGYLCDFDRLCHEIRPADVILVEGRNRLSHVIQRVTQSPWSHATLYLGRMHDIADPVLREQVHKHYHGPAHDQLIIESMLGKGTTIESITKYRDDHLRICRPTGLSYKDTQNVIAYTVSRIGVDYNVRHFFDLGRFLLASRFVPRRWKSSLFQYDVGQATQDMCSTMIANAFASIKFPVLPFVQEDHKHRLELIQRNPKLFTPSDFDYSPYFDIIKYPIFHLSERAHYRDLPWHEGAIYSDEVGIEEKQENRDKDEDKKKGES